MGSSKPQYFTIGIFVIIATALGLVGVVLLSSDALRAPERFIETYVDESVQGIDVGTPFKLRGVKVGSVSEIAMVSSEYDTAKMYVMIRIALEKSILKIEDNNFEELMQDQIEKGLRLKLIPLGITGLSFVEANFFPDTDADPLEINWKPNHIYVPSTPATMSLVSRSLERLSAQLDTLNLKKIGNNIESITSQLNISVLDIGTILKHASDVSEEVAENVLVASRDLPSITSNLMRTSDQFEGLIDSSDQDIDHVLLNLRYISDDARELIRMIKRYPGVLLSEPPEKSLSR
ncbi:MAG: MlaD family protein [Pontiella sp.]